MRKDFYRDYLYISGNLARLFRLTAVHFIVYIFLYNTKTFGVDCRLGRSNATLEKKLELDRHSKEYSKKYFFALSFWYWV